jgi:hypothetical protein
MAMHELQLCTVEAPCTREADNFCRPNTRFILISLSRKCSSEIRLASTDYAGQRW